MSSLKKPYEGHEIAYRRMRAEGVRSWDDMQRGTDAAQSREHDENDERFLIDALAQPWAPRGGRALELGCGTGPMLRWVARRGFTGVGVDVCPTAVRMAREQSLGLPLRYLVADLCRPLPRRLGTFDLILDGHCLHCVTQDLDRAALLANARQVLRPGGLFLAMTMCGPVDRAAFSRLLPRQHLYGGRIYVQWAAAMEYEGARTFDGVNHFPTRRVLHWRQILRELREVGFFPRLLRVNQGTADDPTSSLCVAAGA